MSEKGASVDTTPVLYLTVGLPGAGKTTLARRLADELGILEGRMIWVAHEVLTSGSSVVLDFGCWSPEERLAIRAVAESVRARFDMQEIHIDEPERRARAGLRWQTSPESAFPMTGADHDRFLALYQPPSLAELSQEQLPEPPAGFENWLHWASNRWPTLPRLDQVRWESKSLGWAAAEESHAARHLDRG
jgi:hypothetical protein